MHFETEYKKIIEKVHSINPVAYSRTRNYINGSVTHLSPYLTHGVISLPLARGMVLEKYSKQDCYTFIFELAWREFFQRTYEREGDAIFQSLRHEQEGVSYRDGLPQAYLKKETTILAIDKALHELETIGYVHNHARMWMAMLVTVIAKTSWEEGARHMYYHLLDGDRASNTLSWQWVAGTFSSKQYIANQEMINKYAEVKELGTYLDHQLEVLSERGVPDLLSPHAALNIPLDDSLLSRESISLPDIVARETWLYSMWTLDPKWEPTEAKDAQKILFIDKDDLKRFPMSKKRLQFVLDLSKNIEGIKLYYGSLSEMTAALDSLPVYKKHHPSIVSFPGKKSEPEYLFPQVHTIPGGFMSFWKKCEPYL